MMGWEKRHKPQRHSHLPEVPRASAGLMSCYSTKPTFMSSPPQVGSSREQSGSVAVVADHPHLLSLGVRWVARYSQCYAARAVSETYRSLTRPPTNLQPPNPGRSSGISTSVDFGLVARKPLRFRVRGLRGGDGFSIICGIALPPRDGWGSFLTRIYHKPLALLRIA